MALFIIGSPERQKTNKRHPKTSLYTPKDHQDQGTGFRMFFGTHHDLPSGVAKLCAPEFHLVGACMRAPMQRGLVVSTFPKTRDGRTNSEFGSYITCKPIFHMPFRYSSLLGLPFIIYLPREGHADPERAEKTIVPPGSGLRKVRTPRPEPPQIGHGLESRRTSIP
ncbi:hypothetical protein CRG98_018222 [Punica granatum]|uniref:Uncharacterized protein n=1 Tax=Punica granatum TaxID=22663 RepID=A0A2I0JYE7_PUNGR|nr:hypothetical protein CRG98_018222 [Punica granatum]